MNILVTGGLGYIGQHVLLELCKKRHKDAIIIADDGSNSSLSTIIDIGKHLKDNTVLRYYSILNALNSHSIDGIIHLAASKSVSESYQYPVHYYNNNIIPIIQLANEGIPIVFASSCAVYGVANSISFPCKSVYGTTKLIGEQILMDRKHVGSISLRLQNVVGCDERVKHVGQKECGVLDIIIDSILNRRVFEIYGTYNTKDGTTERDFVHVSTVAESFVKSLDFCMQFNKQMVFDIGSEIKTSLKELINLVEEVTEEKVYSTIDAPRFGDIVSSVANNKIAKDYDLIGKQVSLKTAIKQIWNMKKSAMNAKKE